MRVFQVAEWFFCSLQSCPNGHGACRAQKHFPPEILLIIREKGFLNDHCLEALRPTVMTVMDCRQRKGVPYCRTAALLGPLVLMITGELACDRTTAEAIDWLDRWWLGPPQFLEHGVKEIDRHHDQGARHSKFGEYFLDSEAFRTQKP